LTTPAGGLQAFKVADRLIGVLPRLARIRETSGIAVEDIDGGSAPKMRSFEEGTPHLPSSLQPHPHTAVCPSSLALMQLSLFRNFASDEENPW
jgi:hypothetical protein